MKYTVSGLLLSALALTGCVDLNSEDVVVAPSLGEVGRLRLAAAAAQEIEAVDGGDRLDELMAALERLNRGGASEGGTLVRALRSREVVLDSGSQAADELLREPAVRQVVAAMIDARDAAARGETGARKTTISPGAVYALGRALGSAKRSMVDDLGAGTLRLHSGLTRGQTEAMLAARQPISDKPTFAAVLATYYKALANGKFVDRRGQQLAKLKHQDGIGNETLGELVTVFFEALFDHALMEEYPLYFRTGAPTTVLTTRYAPATFGGAAPVIDYTNVDTLDRLSARFSGRDLVAVSVVPAVKAGEKEYLLTDGKAPTAVAAKIVREIDINDPNANADRVTESQLQAVRTVSNFVGERAKGVSSLVFGFLGKIDISFVLGAGFSVGDNKTLQEMVAAIAEVASRRGSEHAAYSLVVKNNRDSMRVLPAAAPGAPAAPQPVPFWKRLADVPDAN